MSEILDDFPENQVPSLKERHGCVTVWLVLMLIGNSAASIINLYLGQQTVASSTDLSPALLWALGGLGILNILFVVLLFQWKKLGFYGFFITTFFSLVINIFIGIIPIQALIGLAGIAVLHKMLRMKMKNGKRAWSNLE